MRKPPETRKCPKCPALMMHVPAPIWPQVSHYYGRKTQYSCPKCKHWEEVKVT